MTSSIYGILRSGLTCTMVRLLWCVGFWIELFAWVFGWFYWSIPRVVCHTSRSVLRLFCRLAVCCRLWGMIFSPSSQYSSLSLSSSCLRFVSRWGFQVSWLSSVRLRYFACSFWWMMMMLMRIGGHLPFFSSSKKWKRKATKDLSHESRCTAQYYSTWEPLEYKSSELLLQSAELSVSVDKQKGCFRETQQASIGANKPGNRRTVQTELLTDRCFVSSDLEKKQSSIYRRKKKTQFSFNNPIDLHTSCASFLTQVIM
jgi:hypothetical protein